MKIIKFTTRNKDLIKLSPIIPMREYKPQWYKDLNLNTKEALQCPIFKKFNYNPTFPSITAKGCPAIKDYLDSGYIIPWPAEIIFQTTIVENKRKINTYTNDSGLISSHYSSQLPNLNTDFFKINSPWTIQTPKGYSCLFFQPTFFFETRYVMLPGIVDTDRHPMPVNFPGYTLNNEFKVSLNEPMICVMPFKRDEFKFKMNFSDNIVDQRYNRFSLLFKNVYKKYFWTKKKFI